MVAIILYTQVYSALYCSFIYDVEYVIITQESTRPTSLRAIITERLSISPTSIKLRAIANLGDETERN